MAILRQQLQHLQSNRASQDEDHHKLPTGRVGQNEGKPQQRKCGEAFNLGRGQYRTSVDRRQRHKYNKGQRHPAGNNRYSLNHRR